ncbi:MAG: hypothetical protein WKG07_26785 [Hymenobacter sp.]
MTLVRLEAQEKAKSIFVSTVHGVALGLLGFLLRHFRFHLPGLCAE